MPRLAIRRKTWPKEGFERWLINMLDPCSRAPGSPMSCFACPKAYKSASGIMRHLKMIHDHNKKVADQQVKAEGGSRNRRRWKLKAPEGQEPA